MPRDIARDADAADSLWAPLQAQGKTLPSLAPVALSANQGPHVVVTRARNKSMWIAFVGAGALLGLVLTAVAIGFVMQRTKNAVTAIQVPTAVTAAPIVVENPAPANTETQTETAVVTPIATATASVEIKPAPKTPSVKPGVVAMPASTAGTTVAAKPAKSAFGTIQTFAVASGKPVYVDGAQVGVGGTRIKAACGRHAVAVGTAKAKSVDIPCGKMVTVGTPDGT